MWKKIFDFLHRDLFSSKPRIADFSKLCKDCKYSKLSKDMPQHGYCTQHLPQTTQRSLVDGQLKNIIPKARDCDLNRQWLEPEYCGPEGKFWEKKGE